MDESEVNISKNFYGKIGSIYLLKFFGGFEHLNYNRIFIYITAIDNNLFQNKISEKFDKICLGYFNPLVFFKQYRIIKIFL